MGNSVMVTDVTLREFGQNVPSEYLSIFNPQLRAEICRGIVDSGFKRMEIFSCVSPSLAPSMGDSQIKDIIELIKDIKGIEFITLVPNLKGYERFLSLGLGPDGLNHSMGGFFSVVEEHNLLNLGCTIKESLAQYQEILKDAKEKGIRVNAYLSASFGYWSEKESRVIKPDFSALNDYIDMMLDLGAQRIILTDLQGVADRKETIEIFEQILKRNKRETHMFGYHPHHISPKDAVENSIELVKMGIRNLDSSLGGTGGCITGAPGNQPTEELILQLHRLGYETGVNEKRLLLLSERVDKCLYSKIPAGIKSF